MATEYPGLKSKVSMDRPRSSKAFLESVGDLVQESIFELTTSIHSQRMMRVSDISKPARSYKPITSSTGENVYVKNIDSKGYSHSNIKAKVNSYSASMICQSGSQIAGQAFIANTQLDRLEGRMPYYEYETCRQKLHGGCAACQDVFAQQRFSTSLVSTESPIKAASMRNRLCWMADVANNEADQRWTSEKYEWPQKISHHACRDIQIEPFIIVSQLPLRIHTMTPAKTVTKIGNQLFANGLQIKAFDLFLEHQNMDEFEGVDQDLIPDFNWMSLESLSSKVLNWILIKSKGISVYFMEDASIIVQTVGEDCPKLQHLEDRWLARYQVNSEIFESTARGTCIQGDLVYFLDQQSQLRCLDQIELAFTCNIEASCYKASVLGDGRYVDIEYTNSALYTLQADGMVHMFNFKNKKYGQKKFDIDMSLQNEAYRQGSQEWYSAFSAHRCSLIAAHYEPATKRVTFILKTGKLLRMCKDRPSLLAIPSQDFHIHAIKTITIKNLALYAAFTTDGLLHLLASRQSRLQIAGRSTRICRGRYMSSCLLNTNSILVCSGTGQTMLRLEDRVTDVALHF